ncbi:MAG: 50S ribosomal protein L24 [Pseudomonadota bacterium]
MAAKLKKGDKVVVLSGRDKGKEGEITLVMPKENRAVVSGINMVVRHTRPSQGSQGGRIPKEAPIQISNLALIDPKEGGPTRVGFRFQDDGTKVRYAKKSGEVIDG